MTINAFLELQQLNSYVTVFLGDDIRQWLAYTKRASSSLRSANR